MKFSKWVQFLFIFLSFSCGELKIQRKGFERAKIILMGFSKPAPTSEDRKYPVFASSTVEILDSAIGSEPETRLLKRGFIPAFFYWRKDLITKVQMGRSNFLDTLETSLSKTLDNLSNWICTSREENMGQYRLELVVNKMSISTEIHSETEVIFLFFAATTTNRHYLKDYSFTFQGRYRLFHKDMLINEGRISEEFNMPKTGIPQVKKNVSLAILNQTSYLAEKVINHSFEKILNESQQYIDL